MGGKAVRKPIKVKNKEGSISSMKYLDPESAKFERTTGGFLSLRIGRKKPHPRVHLYRVFPLSEPSKYISVRAEDDKEITMIESLEDFPKETVKLMEEELERRYFSPTIQKVISIKDEFGYTYWDTVTDAGACRFTVKSGSSNISAISKDTLLIIDVDGNRFMFPEFEKTEAKYLKVIDTML